MFFICYLLFLLWRGRSFEGINKSHSFFSWVCYSKFWAWLKWLFSQYRNGVIVSIRFSCCGSVSFLFLCCKDTFCVNVFEVADSWRSSCVFLHVVLFHSRCSNIVVGIFLLWSDKVWGLSVRVFGFFFWSFGIIGSFCGVVSVVDEFVFISSLAF